MAHLPIAPNPSVLNATQRDSVWVAAFDAATYVFRRPHAQAMAYADAVLCMLVESGDA